MAVFMTNKDTKGSLYPINAIDGDWDDYEPLLDPAKLKNRFLFGIPLWSHMVDPETKKPEKMTEEMLKDIIIRAVSMVEEETHLTIFPRQIAEKQPFDQQAYQQFGYFRTRQRPVSSVQQVSITPANDWDIFDVPLDWVETTYLARGQLNLIPITPATAMTGSVIPPGQGGAGAFLYVLARYPWIPAFFQITYVAGFPDGKLPRIVNELIGVRAAIEVLSELATTHASDSSHSLGLDGMSQSISTPGPELYNARIQQLEEKKAKLVKRLKVKYGLGIFVGNI